MQKKILITGGAGFIGSNFIRYLYKKYPDYKFIILDLLTYAGDISNIPQDMLKSGRLEFWHGDVRNGLLVDFLVEKSDVVVHFAAETHVTRSIFANLTFFETDVIGTQVVANAVLKCKKKIERFIHISSSEVYGTAKGGIMDEGHPLNPCSPYAAAKAGADRLVYSYWNTYDIPTVIIRLFNNYGFYQHLEKAVPRFITSCFMNELLTVHGAGDAKRDWVFVTDTCDALDRVIHTNIDKIKGEAINIGTGVSTSVKDIACMVLKLCNKSESLLSIIKDRPGQVIRHISSKKKAKTLLGWEPKVSLEDGLRRTVEWYRANEEWWQKQIWMRKIPIITKDGEMIYH